MADQPRFIDLGPYPKFTAAEMLARAEAFRTNISQRRTVRDFSNRSVPREVIETCIMAAGSAPSGANLQPWHFVAVADADTKSQIREAAEEEEREFYQSRAPQEWLDSIAPLGVDANKPFLEIAPYLIVVFRKTEAENRGGKPTKTYYSKESVGIATGILITALHECGLATLTHTPSPMGFLNEILQRPSDERPFLVLVTGFPADKAQVPDIQRKSLSQIATFR